MRLVMSLLVAGCAAAPAERSENTRPTSTETPSATWFKPEVYCPPGTRYEGTVCKPLVVLDCPAGTHFEEGVGCVALQPKPEPTTTAPSFTNQVKPPPPPRGSCDCLPNDLACVMRCQQRMPKHQPPPPAEPLRSPFEQRK
jgi:hypothetical protein